MEQLRKIPVTELRPGMTVWAENLVRGKIVYIPDVYLADYFLSDSYSPREFINGRRLQFKTGNGNQVVWRNSGHVIISVGRVPKGTIAKEYVNG